MPVVEEEGGRLNAYAKEPRMELINRKDATNRVSVIILVLGTLLVVGLLAFSVTIS
tara:strand:+ start:93 stop:260 length:168 start_codon:yes stop_codon:yes gene_type:complete